MSFKLIASSLVLAGSLLASGAASAQSGAAMFAENCAACHQPKGEGVPGAFPALAGNKFVQGDPKGPAYVVTHGRGGMPNFSDDLDDAKIATILSYVRSSWGNAGSPLDTSLVAQVRGAQQPPAFQTGLPAH